ncbi:MAG: exodeoxyribonuclease VII small subunit [Deltaproteobacteria bacterium]
MTAKAKAKKEDSFEDSLSRLEDIVGRLEAGDIDLESSVAAFEEGVALVRALNKRLDTVQSKIEKLARSAGGVLETEELEDG